MRIRTFVVDDEPLARLNCRACWKPSRISNSPANSRTADRPPARSASNAPTWSSSTCRCRTRAGLSHRQPGRRPISDPGVRHGARTLRGPSVRGAGTGLPAEAVPPRTLPRHLGSRAEQVRRTARFAPARAQVERSPDRMIVKCGDRVVVVPFDELAYVRAAANYVQLHLADRTTT